MQPRIRPFRPDDYESVLTIVNANNPEYPETVEEWRHADEKRDPKHKFARWVIEADGQVVGFGGHGQHSDMYHPDKYWIGIDVHPEYQGRGLGSHLYDHVLTALRELNAISVRASAREDQTRSVRFVHDRGFEEEYRVWESRLDPQTFDWAPFADDKARVAAGGFVIKTWSELEHEPDAKRRFYEMFVEADADEPRPEPYTPWSYDFFVERTFSNPNFLPDALFLAIHNGEYAGMSQLWGSQGNDDLYTGLTAVRPAYRRKGMALAMKLRAIAFARDRGTRVIKTWNESTNRPMLSINERLGFVKQPAWINYIKLLREE
jgi:GNAT superfamily N-acetyltransferase